MSLVTVEEVVKMLTTGDLSFAEFRQIRNLTPDEAERLLDTKYQDLEDNAITLPEAARKYEIGRATLHNWAKKGVVGVMTWGQSGGAGGGIPTILEERSVAIAAGLHKMFGGRGSQLFAKSV
jgi:hypothetical protein